MSAPHQSPNLSALLSKLRPFQRTAFEFAVQGTLTSDDNGGTKCEKSSNKAAAYAKRGDEKQRGSKQVAGAGTGRILLGDEMGLG